MNSFKETKDLFKEEKFSNLCTELSYLLTIDKKQIIELLKPFLPS